jgi:hypothetical protein
MDKKLRIQKKIEESTNPVVKNMWIKALKNVNSPKRQVTWDNYFLYMGYISDTRKDKRRYEARERQNG